MTSRISLVRLSRGTVGRFAGPSIPCRDNLALNTERRPALRNTRMAYIPYRLVSAVIALLAIILNLTGSICDGSGRLCFLPPTSQFGIAHTLVMFAMWVYVSGGASKKVAAKPTATRPADDAIHDHYIAAPDQGIPSLPRDATVYSDGWKSMGWAQNPFVLPPRVTSNVRDAASAPHPSAIASAASTSAKARAGRTAAAVAARSDRLPTSATFVVSPATSTAAPVISAATATPVSASSVASSLPAHLAQSQSISSQSMQSIRPPASSDMPNPSAQAQNVESEDSLHDVAFDD